MKNNVIDGTKILYIGHSFNDKGGVSTLERNYQNIIDPYNHIAIFDCGSFIKKVKTLCYGIFSMVKLLCTEKQIKVVHIHVTSGIDFYRNCIPIIVARLFSKRIVLHIHGGAFIVFCQKHRRITTLFINMVDMVFVVSDFLKRELIAFNFSPPIHRLYNILNTTNIQNKRPSNNCEKIIIGFLGAINENKHILDVVYLFHLHHELQDYYNLKIAGVGENDKLIGMINKYNLNHCIDYLGWIDGKEKDDFFNKIDLLVQPSDFESFGLSILEAMAYGIPSIATRVGGIPELIDDGKNGFLIERNDWEELYNKLISIYNDTSIIKKMRKACYERVQLFHPNTICNQLKKYYYCLVK